jgi:hypothetical protein
LRALLANPNDPNAAQAVGQHDPRLGLQVQQRQQQSLQQRLEADRENIIKGGQIFRQLGVKDEASYQQARQMAAQIGMDVSQVPPNYDERYVQGVVSLADTFAPPKQEAQPNIAREVDYYRSIGRDDLAQQLLTRHAEGGPIVAANGDGTFQIIPRNVAQQGQPQGQPQGGPQPGHVEDGYRFKGGNPADPNAWEPMGGQTPQASGTFPAQGN